MKEKKTLFIELDGATWDIINPLLEEGKLPHLKRLIESGASGELISVLPAISPKIWTSIFTGKHHDKTGIDFFGAHSKMVKCKRIWDIFNQHGLKVGVFGSFVTWPPYEVNGFMIPAVDSVGTDTYPEEYSFFQEVTLNERNKSKGIKSKTLPFLNLFYYAYKFKATGVNLTTFLKIFSYLIQAKIWRFKQMDKYWRKLVLHSEISTDVFIHLCKLFDPDFATIHMHICDSICHRYWMAYEPEKFPGIDQAVAERYREVIPKAYMQADRAIGKLLASTDGTVNVVVVSDHGFKAVSGGMNPYDLNIDKFLNILEIREKVIVARFGPGMYINFRDEGHMQEVADVVSNARLQGTDKKVFNARPFEKTLIVTKPNWKVDVEKLMKEHLFIDFGKFGIHRIDEVYIRQQTKMSGVHEIKGIIILAGPNIKHGVRLEPASIYDVSPTVLHLMGSPVAQDMDGRVLTEALDDRFMIENSIRSIDTYEDSVPMEQEVEEIDHKKIEERLKSMGYL